VDDVILVRSKEAKFRWNKILPVHDTAYRAVK
jgi:hypothetical protein